MKKLIITLAAALTLAACGNKNDQEMKTNETTAAANTEWQEITPQQIDTNAVKLFADDWMVLSAGNKDKMNMMTIAWGGLGELWNKPVVTVYVSTSRYTNELMESNDCFTVCSFPKEYRDTLQYLGTVSGRDEDKLKGSGLTVEFTDLGNPIYKEATLAIECRKIYCQQFESDKLPKEQQQWYKDRGIGLHVMYIGEIVHVWKK